MLAVPATYLATVAGADDSHTYNIEMYNAFGIVKGSDVRIAGVNAGSVTDLDLTAEKRALVTVETSGDLGTLGKDTRCSSEPQSLIAEYFITCTPKGPPLPEDGTIPASRVTQTVQSDLVQNTLREPFKVRLQLLINEFGTALAGNAQELNEAIRLGAPALRQLTSALDILAEQNTTIRDLNVNSDVIIRELAARRQDVIRFIQEARDTAAISAQRRDDLSADFDKLDDFLHELRPTLARLGDVAEQQTPLLTDLRAAAPGLNTLALKLPAFNRATERSLKTLGHAAVPGRQALKQGRDEIQALAASGKNAFKVADTLDKFLLDIDSPRRKVEIDDRAANTCPAGTPDPKTKPCYSTGRDHPTGYTGMESLLNYVYYQTGAINQFDQVGHLLHFSIFGLPSGGLGPCNHYNAGEQEDSFEPATVPTADGGTTTELSEANNCVAWLGPNQPGINQEPGITQISRYDNSVCPQGSTDHALCNPNISIDSSGKVSKRSGSGAIQSTGGGTGGGDAIAPGLPPSPLPGSPREIERRLDDLLGIGRDRLRDLGDNLRGGSRSGGGGGGGGLLGGGGGGAGDLLDFLLGP
jgi:virulence factor Mce-like protein